MVNFLQFHYQFSASSLPPIPLGCLLLPVLHQSSNIFPAAFSSSSFLLPPVSYSIHLPMASSRIKEATALKQQGNKAFGQHDWPVAVDYYTKAIDKYDQDPSFFCNRSQVSLSSIRALFSILLLFVANDLYTFLSIRHILN